jgi:hypothetical protein
VIDELAEGLRTREKRLAVIREPKILGEVQAKLALEQDGAMMKTAICLREPSSVERLT